MSTTPEPRLSIAQQYARSLCVNLPQAKAIVSATEKKSGFVLIQGPPGTGKTKTILGLLGALKTAVATEITVPGSTARAAVAHKGRILVCAPSNAAVDEIARRLLSGIHDVRGQTYRPKIVRLGTTSIHPDVKAVSLDVLTEQALQNDVSLQKTGSSVLSAELMRSELLSQFADLKQDREDLRMAESKSHGDANQLQLIQESISRICKEMNTVKARLDSERSVQLSGKLDIDKKKALIRASVVSSAEIM